MYVIAGVTGNTGKVAANTLQSAGKKVRVVVREAGKGKPFADHGAQVAVADLGDPTSLAKAFEGAEGVYVLLPPTFAAKSFRAYQDATSAAIVEAVRAAKVPHVVGLSSVGAQLSSGNGPIAGLHVLEQALRALPDTRSSFIRAAYFMENLGASLGGIKDGVFPSFFPANAPAEMIATQDIGELAAKLLVEGTETTQVVNLAAPPVTMQQAAAIASNLVGKEIRVVEAPLDAVVPTFTAFGAPLDLAELYREMIGGFLAGKIGWEEGHRRVLGTTTLETVLEGLLRK